MQKYDVKFSIIESYDDNRERVAIEPLERGFGNTLGNALRRVMLGHLGGAAVTRVKIDGASHEFSTMKGVYEDVVQLIQNLKLVNFKMTQKKVTIVTLDASGEGEIKASDLKCPTGIEVTNPDQHIATLSEKKSKLKVEITVEYGKGYALPDEREKKSVGVILVDGNFSPVRLATYVVDNTRVGQEVDLDKLVMDVTTDGSITPKEAIQQSAAILNEYFQLLAGETEVYNHAPKVEESEEDAGAKVASDEVYLEELGLPTRVVNTLKKSGFETISDLRKSGEDGLQNVKNIGPKTVKILLKKVESMVE